MTLEGIQNKDLYCRAKPASVPFNRHLTKDDLILFLSDKTNKNKAFNKSLGQRACVNVETNGLRWTLGSCKKKQDMKKTKKTPHLCQVELIIVPAVVLAFIIVASSNDDVHSDHAQDEHVEHRGPHQLLWKQSSVQLQSM